MRLIDADALYKKLKDIRKQEVLIHGRLNNKDCCTLSTALFEIECAPTIEPQPEIINCGECIHAMKDELFGGLWCKGKTVTNYHYCGYAERKEGGADEGD